MASTDGHTARYDRCCEEEERICKLAGSQERFETYRICQLAGSQERFETYRICKLAGSQERFETQGRTRARVQCPAPSPAKPRYDQYEPCHSSRLVIRVPEAPGGELAGGPTSRPMAR